MIQILGLRSFVNDSGVTICYDTYLEKNWRASSVRDLFLNLESIIEQIPVEHRWNLFYTVAECTDKKREFLKQAVIPIDIDGIDAGNEKEVAKCVIDELGLDKEKVGVVFSGNGVHILIGIEQEIENVATLRMQKVYYRALCGRINHALFREGIRGKADPTVFSESRILRLPFTENRKEKKDTKKCIVVKRNIEPLPITLAMLADIPEVTEGEHVHPRAFARMPEPDSHAVQTKCPFIVNCKENQDKVSEPEWYAMLSIVGRLNKGDSLVHEYSKNYYKYSPEHTDLKLSHALEASGPRTCENISSMFSGCVSCPHYGKITSPIQLVSEDHIRTKETGFYNVIIKNGVVTTGKPNYDDLLKFFGTKNKYITVAETEQTYIYNGKFWEEIPKLEVHRFAEEQFDPTPSSTMCKEFELKMKRTNLVSETYFQVSHKVNFLNGALNLDTGKLEGHSPDYGFTYVIPHDYAPTGECPTFSNFIRQVTCNDEELAKSLIQYLGYCISGTDPALVQKCAILYGDGSNGKSVVLSLLRELVGMRNFSSVSMEGLTKETNRYQLMNKLFNVSDETPTNALVNSSAFKAIVSGDVIEIRRLYHNPVNWRCSTKLIFSCNDLPFNVDYSNGMFRRLLIFPFNNVFSHDRGNLDPFILEKLLIERSDIIRVCLEAVQELKKNKYQFSSSKAIHEEIESYKSSNDTVARFIFEMCDYGDEKRALDINTVYRCYHAWCTDNFLRSIQYPTFNKAFGRAITKQQPMVTRVRKAESGFRTTEYRGLIIKAVQNGF